MGKCVETCGQIAHGVSVFVEKCKHIPLNKQILHSTPKTSSELLIACESDLPALCFGLGVLFFLALNCSVRFLCIKHWVEGLTWSWAQIHHEVHGGLCGWKHGTVGWGCCNYHWMVFLFSHPQGIFKGQESKAHHFLQCTLSGVDWESYGEYESSLMIPI